MENVERMAAWDAAGRAVARLVEPGMRVGLGTGRAAAAGIRALGARVADGLPCVGVPTSRASADLARSLGIPLGRLADPLDLAFDGADAVDPSGWAVKGAGGAFVRERIVADAARRFVILVDAPKLVAGLDAWGSLPVAVVPFAARRVIAELEAHLPRRRATRSDDALVIIDIRPEGGRSWSALATALEGMPGVVDHGLFRVALSDVFVGRPDGSVGTPP
ncbi:MAG: ribose 5-phosphate isomerase A [Actinobacteria bacterium]|nr:ribose 5-phosphate isomerase A [Actinomycetota bacterium]